MSAQLYNKPHGRSPSKAAFYRQRQKLREDALPNLLFAFNAFFSILDSRFTDLVIQPGRKRSVINLLINWPLKFPPVDKHSAVLSFKQGTLYFRETLIKAFPAPDLRCEAA